MKKSKTLKQMGKSFADMTIPEMEEWENKANGVIFFDHERGISFQKSRTEDDNALIILIDGIKKPIILIDAQIGRLKQYLNTKF